MNIAKLVSKSAKEVVIQIKVSLSSSMLESEENIRSSLNAAGQLAMVQALEAFDTDGSPIFFGKDKWTSKGKINKEYQTIWGEVDCARHVYQSSKGGCQYCPLERDARILLTATPGFVKLVSLKYAEMGSSRALFDLKESHGRTIARSYLKSLCDAVGAVAQAKEETWTYEIPLIEEPVNSVAVGIDGTCMLLREDGWREAMVGTISLYDANGERQHTIQMGATPEYGKEEFYKRFHRELSSVKAQYPNALYVGIADGAACNWPYLAERTDVQIVDFWHASEYLTKAADAIFGQTPPQKALRKDWLTNACHKLKNDAGSAKALLTEMEEQLKKKNKTMTASKKVLLRSCISYFQNQHIRMDYHKNVEQKIPIGSGVTEAACKTLVKQRLCNSGMRWRKKGAAAVLSLRSLAHTDCRWRQFWEKINQFGFSNAA